jgi:hypothetical protein
MAGVRSIVDTTVESINTLTKELDEHFATVRATKEAAE